jgi:hypothetical protein
MGIHLLHCVHGNKRTGTHDAIHDTIHMGQKQLHVFPSTTFNSKKETHAINESTLCLPKMAFAP